MTLLGIPLPQFVAKQSLQTTKQNVPRFLTQNHATITQKDLVTFVHGSVVHHHHHQQHHHHRLTWW
jgi:hypothetical protein